MHTSRTTRIRNSKCHFWSHTAGHATPRATPTTVCPSGSRATPFWPPWTHSCHPVCNCHPCLEIYWHFWCPCGKYSSHAVPWGHSWPGWRFAISPLPWRAYSSSGASIFFRTSPHCPSIPWRCTKNCR